MLARTEADLGPLARPAPEQVREYGTKNYPLIELIQKYGPRKNAMEAILAEWGGPEDERQKLTPKVVSVRQGPQAATLYQYAIRYRDAGQPNADLGLLADVIFGAMFRPLVADPRVELRTDANRPGLPVIPAPPPKK